MPFNPNEGTLTMFSGIDLPICSVLKDLQLNFNCRWKAKLAWLSWTNLPNWNGFKIECETMQSLSAAWICLMNKFR